MDSSLSLVTRAQENYGYIRSFLYQRFLAPKAPAEDDRRQEFILNVLLLGVSLLIAVADLRILLRILWFGFGAGRAGNLIIITIALAFFLGLYGTSRIGRYRISAYSAVSLLFLLSTYTLVTWDIGNPQGLLIYVIVIVLAGILLGRAAALTYTLLSIASLFVIVYLNTHGINHPDTSWATQAGKLTDAIGFASTLFIIYLVSWLSNREITNSLARARYSEQELTKERNSLEIKVAERTAELRHAQEEQIMQLYRFAEFGRLASGLFHDIATPLTAVSLNLEKLNKTEQSTLLDRALSGTHYVEQYISAIRTQIRSEKTQTRFSIGEEITQTLQTLTYKARSRGVTLTFTPPEEVIFTYGSPVRFHQIILNLVSNAIDAYPEKRAVERREVAIRLQPLSKQQALLEVQDWGMGIPAENVQQIFQPFFTTKSTESGTGIGLSLVKETVERELEGTIKVESRLGSGTTFTITFSLYSESDHHDAALQTST